jgi:hypothetical protein
MNKEIEFSSKQYAKIASMIQHIQNIGILSNITIKDLMFQFNIGNKDKIVFSHPELKKAIEDKKALYEDMMKKVKEDVPGKEIRSNPFGRSIIDYNFYMTSDGDYKTTIKQQPKSTKKVIAVNPATKGMVEDINEDYFKEVKADSLTEDDIKKAIGSMMNNQTEVINNIPPDYSNVPNGGIRIPNSQKSVNRHSSHEELKKSIEQHYKEQAEMYRRSHEDILKKRRSLTEFFITEEQQKEIDHFNKKMETAKHAAGYLKAEKNILNNNKNIN